MLTAGADTGAAFTGTDKGDVFNALTINAAGTPDTTLSAFDKINGGAGIDKLNIYSNGTTLNGTMSAFTTVENVEIINIYNDTAAFSTDGANNVEANKFVGSTLINQVGVAANVKNLANTQTAKFTDTVIAGAGAGVTVTALDAATKANIELSNFDETKAVTVLSTTTGSALNEVNIAGTVKDTGANGIVAKINVNVTVGKDVETLTLNSAVASTLAITQSLTATENVTTVDASTSKGDISFAGKTITNPGGPAYAYEVTTIKTGSGNDIVTLEANTVADNAATAADETVNASVSTGAGDDIITVDTGSASLGALTKTGATTVDAGAGDDEVTITTRSDGKLTVNLGDGDDTFTSAVAIKNGDVIDAGAGIDTLLLKLVGAANVSSFKNFDVYDVNGMNNHLDLAMLNTNNNVTEIVASGDLGGNMTLTNLAHNVGYRVIAETALGTAARVLTLTQKAAGVLTITNDIDETSLPAADTGLNDADMAVIATNATSVNAVFDADFFGKAGATPDNTATITLTTAAATSLTVVSGGDNATNILKLNDTAAAGKLTSISINGDKALSVTSSTATSVLETVDASKMTGGLTMSIDNLKEGGELMLGSGVDVITVTNASGAVTDTWASINNFEKALAVSVNTVATTAVKNAAIADADKLVLASGTVANSTLAATAPTGATLSNGVLAWEEKGPTTLDGAIAIADLYAEAQHEVVLFEYLGNSYVFKQGDADHDGTTNAVTAADTLVKLVGVTGVTNLELDGANNFFIV